MTLKRALMVMMACWCALTCLAGRFIEDSVKVDGYMRHMVIYLPDGLQHKAPAVFILHGYGAARD